MRASCFWVIGVCASTSFLGCGGTSGNDPGGNDGGGNDSGGTMNIDACQLVTQTEAAAIFEQPATRQTFVPPIPPHLIAECEWAWDVAPTPETAASQLILVYVYDTTAAYARPADAEPYDIGEMGYVRLVAGVDIDWVQDGRTINFAYSNVGAGLPPATTKVDAMKAQAQKISQRL